MEDPCNMKETLEAYASAIENGLVAPEEVEKVLKADFSMEAIERRKRFRTRVKKEMKHTQNIILPDGSIIAVKTNKKPEGSEE